MTVNTSHRGEQPKVGKSLTPPPLTPNSKILFHRCAVSRAPQTPIAEKIDSIDCEPI